MVVVVEVGVVRCGQVDVAVMLLQSRFRDLNVANETVAVPR